jgi:hypothetical protein
MKDHFVSIWYIIGIILTIYGVLITGSGIYQYIVPPATPTVLAQLHAGIWWGALILGLGIFYTLKFRPAKSNN